MPSETYIALGSVTLSTAQSQVTFSNIPQTYTDLVLIASNIVPSTGMDVIAYVNGDRKSNYSTTALSANGTGPGAGYTINQTQMYVSDYFVGIGGSNPTMFTVNCMNYSNNTTNKTFISRGAIQGASAREVNLLTSLWRSTAAVNSITLQASSGTMGVGTTFSLYGIGGNQLKATGGDIITTDGTYWYHAFTQSGTFTPQTTLSCDVLVVAGGGGAGRSQSGGGGAGGLVYSTSNSFSTSQAVVVGAGGAAGTANGRGTNGSNSTLGSLTAAVGGGSGGAYDSPAGGNGGSGGGAASSDQGGTSWSGGTATSGQGNAGGGTSGYGSPYRGGGGGGAGAAGTAGYTSSGKGGDGTNTYSTWLNTTGTGVGGYIAGGGGGGMYGGSPAGAGGLGGGGRGGDTATFRGVAGLVNTGSGGGGSDYGADSGAGGSGLVIVRYAV